MILEEINYKVYLLIIALFLLLCIIPLGIRFFYFNNISNYNSNNNLNNKNINLDNKNLIDNINTPLLQK